MSFDPSDPHWPRVMRRRPRGRRQARGPGIEPRTILTSGAPTRWGDVGRPNRWPRYRETLPAPRGHRPRETTFPISLRPVAQERKAAGEISDDVRRHDKRLLGRRRHDELRSGHGMISSRA
jgi:hypothetical protein